MPSLVAWLLSGLGWALTSAFGRIMTSLGLAFIVNTVVVDPMIDAIAGYFGGLPAFIVGLMGWFEIDTGITIIISAYGVRAAAGRVTGLMRRGAASGALS